MAENNEAKELFIPMFLTVTLAGLIGKFRIQIYEDLELIRDKKKVLQQEFEKAKEKAAGDNDELNRLWNADSELSKKEFAWLSQDAFKATINGLGLQVDDLILLETWIVK